MELCFGRLNLSPLGVFYLSMDLGTPSLPCCSPHLPTAERRDRGKRQRSLSFLRTLFRQTLILPSLCLSLFFAILSLLFCLRCCLCPIFPYPNPNRDPHPNPNLILTHILTLNLNLTLNLTLPLNLILQSPL